MNIRQMAAVNVAKIVGCGLATGVLVSVGIQYFGLATVGTILAIAMLIYMIKFMYDIELSKLESKNALTKLRELK
jgi:uncharacterized membrane protein